jgi:hypothetical protein
MGTTYRFIEQPGTPSEVMAWFRALPQPPNEIPTESAMVLHFHEFGSLVYDSDRKVDMRQSPVVSVYLPQERRGALWTVGEVHFLATPLRKSFPQLHKISAAFSSWLATHDCVYSNKSASNVYDYYLEGSVKNFDSPVFALNSGITGLRAGRYFIADQDNDFVLDKLCRALALRGVKCAGA